MSNEQIKLIDLADQSWFCTKLHSLNLSDNGLRVLPSKLAVASNLKVLNCHNNNLTEFTTSLTCPLVRKQFMNY